MTSDLIYFFATIAITFVIYYLLPKKIRPFVLLIASFAFYIHSSKLLTIYLIVTTLIIYIVGLLIGKVVKREKEIIDTISLEDKKKLKLKYKKQKRLYVLIAVLINIGILLYLKYFNFFSDIFNSIFADDKISYIKILLPLGISYYTLIAISYVIDVYRAKIDADKNILRLSLFLTFFPQMTMGPFNRYSDTANDLYTAKKFDFENFKYGITLILIGLFKKMVIADRCSIFVNNVFGTNETGSVALLAVMLYTVQIYFEFSGFMDIVNGAARLFNVKMAENFKTPFLSKSVQEFWQRWHVSLGAWLKDYIFYPVSLSKVSMWINTKAKKVFKGNFGKFIPVAFSLFFVWILNGLWHGASIKYVMYGMYYYLIMMLALMFKPLSDKILNFLKIKIESTGYQIWGIIRTTIIVFGGMLLFRSHSITGAIDMLKNILKPVRSNIDSLGLVNVDFLLIIITIIIFYLIGYLNNKNINLYEKFNKSNIVIRYMGYLVIILLIIIFGIYGSGYNASDFIYGQF